MSSEPEGVSEGTTYVGFDMETPEDKQALHVEAARAGHTNLAPFIREIVYREIESIELDE